VRTRLLGRTGLAVSPIVFGAMAYRRCDDAIPIDTLRAAIEVGITTIDTAPVYGFGSSESLVGRAIVGRRHRVQVLTKVGLRWDDDHGDVLFAFDDGGQTIRVRKDARPASVRRDVEGSLRRLGIEHIDLCQVHHPDRHTPIAETMGTLLELRREGKIAHIGVSNFSVDECRSAQDALGDVPLCSHQLELNPLRRENERHVLPHCRRAQIGVLTYAPLMHGLLAGRGLGRRRLEAGDARGWDPAFHPTNAARVAEALRHAVLPVAVRLDVTVAEVVLAWVLARPGVTAIVAGASSPQQARRNARAATLELDEASLARITRAFEAVVLDPDLRPPSTSRLSGLPRRILARLTSDRL
jgi:methylglyoxal reductase